MTVFAYEQDDQDNPLAKLSVPQVQALPYGAVELGKDGLVVTHIDTEPGDGAAAAVQPGNDFFKSVAPWAGNGDIAREFRKGVEAGPMNVVFDCAVDGLHYKVRVHLKTSPILGTYWIFIKKLTRR